MLIRNVAAFAPATTDLATSAGQTPVTLVTQSLPYPAKPRNTFDAGIIEVAYLTVLSVQESGPIGPGFATE